MFWNKKVLLIISMVFIYLMLQNSIYGADIVQGEAFLYVKPGLVEFPKEIYGLAISFPEKSIQVKVDSVYFLNYYGPKRHDYNDEHILKNNFINQHSTIYDQIKLNFSTDLIEIFKKYGVYSIERVYKPYLPSDTIPRPHVKRNGTTIIYKGKNENTFLFVKFDPNKNVYDFLSDIQKINGIQKAEEVPIVKEGALPNDPSYLGTQTYLQPGVTNFEEGWDIIKGQNGDPIVTIGIIDKDFSNCEWRYDLSANLNTNGHPTYVGNGEGHGTKVASVACAVTHNTYLMAGATWNCKFMPFVAQDPNDIYFVLRDILIWLRDDEISENNCYVVNISMYYETYNQSIETLCNNLYNDFDVIICAAVSNEWTTSVVYPAAYSSVIGVGATNQDGTAIMYPSGHGSDVELVAPGWSILVLNPAYDATESVNGTSFATPIDWRQLNFPLDDN